MATGPSHTQTPTGTHVRRPVLVTGAAGFAGSHLLDLLRLDHADGNGRPIIGWHHPGLPPRDTNGHGNAITWRAVELLDPASVRAAIADAQPAEVYHLAGAAQVGNSWDHADTVLQINVMGTHHLLDAINRANVAARVVVIGSAMVYRPSNEPLDEDSPIGPTSPYGLSKLAQELVSKQAHLQHQTQVIVARSFNHIGPRQGLGFVAADFARQLVEIEAGGVAPVIRVGNLEAQRDLMDVRDTVRAYRAMMQGGEAGEAYNVCAGRAISMRALLDGLLRHSSTRVDVQIDPNKLRPVDQPIVLGSFSRLARATGWHPEIPMDRTLADLLDYWRAQPRD